MQHVQGRDPPFELYNFTGAEINVSKTYIIRLYVYSILAPSHTASYRKRIVRAYDESNTSTRNML